MLVHLPLGLAAAWPWVALALLVAIRRGALPERAWWLAVALSAAVAASAYAAVETGEWAHEEVEDFVDHDRIHEHEEAGELFLWISAAGALASALGLVRAPRLARAGRAASVVVALAALAAGARAGHLGGRLVYVHGAARAYVEAAPALGAEEIEKESAREPPEREKPHPHEHGEHEREARRGGSEGSGP